MQHLRVSAFFLFLFHCIQPMEMQRFCGGIKTTWRYPCNPSGSSSTDDDGGCVGVVGCDSTVPSLPSVSMGFAGGTPLLPFLPPGYPLCRAHSCIPKIPRVQQNADFQGQERVFPTPHPTLRPETPRLFYAFLCKSPGSPPPSRGQPLPLPRWHGGGDRDSPQPGPPTPLIPPPPPPARCPANRADQQVMH